MDIAIGTADVVNSVNVTDLINWIVQILKRELIQLRISIQDTGLIKPVKPQDKGQPNYITKFSIYIHENAGM